MAGMSECIGHIFDGRPGGNWSCERCGLPYAARLRDLAKEEPRTQICANCHARNGWPEAGCSYCISIRRLAGRRGAQGTEAQRAETENTGSVHDGPVGKADAPKGEGNG